VSGNPQIAIPAGWQIASGVTPFGDYYGPCRIRAAGNLNVGIVVRDSSTALGIRHQAVSGTRITPADVSATSPATFTAGDSFLVDVVIPVEPA
jgi:hypothetical protein